ncbi:MAG: VWA domain-containing protein, partial [Bacteroidetes bacterium]
YWDLSRQLWEQTSFDILQRYHELLEREDAVRELADLLGRMREAEIVLEEETYESVIVRKQWEEDRLQKSEIIGSHHSDDLSALLSSEASLLGDPDTETLFLQKYADKGLLTFRYEDRQLVESEDQFTEVNQRVKQREKGPFIVCVDTSDSMSGRPEQIAKVLCFGILKMAARENRRAFLINFSTGIQTLDLYNLSRSLDDIAAFLQMSFHAGTDISLALYEVLRQLETEAYRDADVLVISDFIMYRIEGDILERMREQQQRGTQFHSLILHQDPNAEVIDRFDTNWVYDPEQPHLIRELAGTLRVLGARRGRF